MSNKTNFKRIALAVVAALGFGVLATGPSNAAPLSHTIAFATGSAATATATAGETVTVSITSSLSGLNNTESATVVGVGSSKPTTGSYGTFALTTDSVNATSSGSAAAGYTITDYTAGASSMKFTYSLTSVVAGTYVIDFYGVEKGGAATAALRYTLTVAAKNVTPDATKSLAKINACAAGAVCNSTVASIIASGDSAVVKSKSDTIVAVIATDLRNSADTNIVTGTQVSESVTAVITGSGLLSAKGGSTTLRAVSVTRGETITVWADGTTGTGTITLTTSSLATWTSKTVTFFGTPTSATLTAFKSATAKNVADSATALRVVLKDASQNLYTSAQTLYVHSSDSRVVNNGSVSVTVSASTGYGNFSLAALVGDTGTTKLKVATYAFGATPAATDFVSNEVDFKVVGGPASVSLSLDKATYNPGDNATVTLTVKDANGNLVPDQTISGLLASGIDFSTGTDVTDTVIATTAGVKTYTYTMPTTGMNVVTTITGGAGVATADQIAESVTVTVLNPAEDAANSALDAAQEATDAAIAATDAAILAQEAADEAASAAIAAQETAQAAVDAVTALSAEVTKLVAQLATLQKLLNRVAKRVGVKL